MSKSHSRVLFLAVTALAAGASASRAVDLITPGDFVIGIDRDPPTVQSSFPGAEGPTNVVDGNSGTKYLNFGKLETGFIVTPAAPSIVQSFTLTTANDAVERDPASYQLYGTNSPITSTNNSGGFAEPWTLISSGSLALPDTRLTLGPVVNVTNSTSYSSYKMIFPTVKDAGTANSMQVADAQFFTGSGGSGSPVLAAGNAVVAVANATFQSRSPGAEQPANGIDGDGTTKYLNFGKENSGLIVKPSKGRSIVNGLKIITANDSPSRDPINFEIWGTDAAIQSAPDSQGTGEPWTLITTGTLNPPTDRGFESPEVTFANTAAYNAYKIVFTSIRDTNAVVAVSMQVSEIQLDGTLVAAPEPGSAALLLGAGGFAALVRRRRPRA
jgi:hypothetical protein